MKSRIIIVFAGRFPSEKAAGLFLAQNAEAFSAAGKEVIILASRRFGRLPIVDVPYVVRYLPTIDLSGFPSFIARYSNYLSVGVFAISACIWLCINGNRTDVVISNDAFPLLLATLAREKTMYEMHDFAPSTFLFRALLTRVKWILATNEWKRDETIKQFSIEPKKVVVERNSVDINMFGTLAKKEARSALGLSEHAQLVVYTGHLYAWKGVDTLAGAMQSLPDVTLLCVGGVGASLEEFKQRWGAVGNIQCIGAVPHDRIALYQSAADILALPNSAHEEISVHHTSPMKLFEYMASERPIVASRLPSILEVLPEDMGYYADADNPASFAAAISAALNDSDSRDRARAARAIVLEYSWEKRIERLTTVFQSAS
jgi:glycosyltransferase involved in cell wall biosynthesis